MEVTNESNPKSLGLCHKKTTGEVLFISDFIGPINGILSLFDADEVQQNSWKPIFTNCQQYLFLLRR